MKRVLQSLILPFLLFLVACAHPSPSGHVGLFDYLAGLESGRSGRAKSWSERELYRITSRWQWPLRRVVVTSEYGRRGFRYHDGIDLRARRGTRVHAAHAGRVVYSGRRISGYGNLIILRDGSGLLTVYAHNRKNLVRKNQYVQKGELIAYSGSTGRTSGPHLHFEIRNGTDTIDPLQVMPSKTDRRYLAGS